MKLFYLSLHMQGLSIFRNRVSKLSFAVVLSIALLLPYAAESVHRFDHHHHVCYDATPHFHKKTLDCTLCNFQFPVYNFESYVQGEVTLPETKYQIFVRDDFKGSFFNSFFVFRRGPPSFS